MNYETASVDVFNKRLANLLGVNWSASAQDGLIVPGQSSSVNYCENWGDIMPLFVKYGISIETADATPCGKVSAWEAYCLMVDDWCFHRVVDKCPLRAIVICLIKVLEAKG